MNIPVLETERLILRGHTIQDLDQFAEMNSNKQFRRYLATGETLTREESWKAMATMLGHWQLRGYGIWAIEEKGTNCLVGHAGLLNPEGWPGIEACWGLSPDHWGNGYATEAVKKCIEWAFANLEIDSLISLIYPDNEPSIKLAMRIGETFQKEIELFNSTVNIYAIKKSDIHTWK